MFDIFTGLDLRLSLESCNTLISLMCTTIRAIYCLCIGAETIHLNVTLIHFEILVVSLN